MTVISTNIFQAFLRSKMGKKLHLNLKISADTLPPPPPPIWKAQSLGQELKLGRKASIIMTCVDLIEICLHLARLKPPNKPVLISSCELFYVAILHEKAKTFPVRTIFFTIVLLAMSKWKTQECRSASGTGYMLQGKTSAHTSAPGISPWFAVAKTTVKIMKSSGTAIKVI